MQTPVVMGSRATAERYNQRMSESLWHYYWSARRAILVTALGMWGKMRPERILGRLPLLD